MTYFKFWKGRIGRYARIEVTPDFLSSEGFFLDPESSACHVNSRPRTGESLPLVEYGAADTF
jgi:hypothetical protein